MTFVCRSSQYIILYFFFFFFFSISLLIMLPKTEHIANRLQNETPDLSLCSWSSDEDTIPRVAVGKPIGPPRRYSELQQFLTPDLSQCSLSDVFDELSVGDRTLAEQMKEDKIPKVPVGKPIVPPRQYPELITSSNPNLSTRCNRIIKSSKYEKNDQAVYGWWQNLFQTLEHDADIPPEEQYDVLESLFNSILLPKILESCATRNRLLKEELESLSDDDILQIRTEVRERVDDASFPTNKRDALTKETVQSSKERSAKDVLTSATEAPVEVSKCKMYMNFFKRKPNRAAVWRTLPPLSMNEMNLNQKAEAITEQIATDFINWLRDLGGDEELSLSVQSIIEMFEIGFHANSARSLKVGLKELPAVSKRIAIAKKCPQKAKRAVLRQEIVKDMRASKKKTTCTAFGRQLPPEMQVRPPAENYFKKWRSCDRVPERLASMAAVWQGITHLKSTRAYCEFLLQRPEIKPPKYLLDAGMMDLRKLREEDTKSDDFFVEIS
ncbi:unnamed protein product [Ceutorhynchus assimilis]|uniref:Uncharacterized protein n=1 Tax=Ceutorhynchus assimilis TaxID=467358 RepID=A0A9N9MT85_9CUCU|nr:unnamed protein product [Ceutorhynchus assimilis]